MPRPTLLDTDVVIDYLRDRPDAVQWLESRSEPLLVSVVTVAELYSGVREGKERADLEAFLQALEVVPVDEEIARAAGLFRRQFARSHRTELPDALIAATAEKSDAQLVTLNRKHFPMIPDVLVPYEKV